MNKGQLLTNIKVVEHIASVSKLKRMLMQPFKYTNAIFFREVIYKKSKQEKEVTATTFFDTSMHLLLPSSTDIYLTGGKSHDSEIRLAKFLINQLNPADTFIDVGAHYGYFTLLASKLVGEKGTVHSFEASPTTHRILKKNTAAVLPINSHNLAVSDEESILVFHEFPNLYSEYNSLDVEQFEGEGWFAEATPKKVEIKSIILDEFLLKEKLTPKVIKIDVEGAEYKVIKGLKQLLAQESPLIVLEYLSAERGNEAHRKAEQLLNSLQYKSYTISTEGTLEPIEQLSKYLQDRKLDSDNIVFMKE